MDTYSQSGSGGNNVIAPVNNIGLNGWTEQHEEIFAEWADKAMCFRWLHNRSLKIFERRNAGYTIPVIIMSTISGTASFALDSLPDDYKLIAQWAIGTVNITAGVITTIQQFLKITQLLEAHRVSCISWGKFCQDIKVELIKHPNDRESPLDMLKLFKAEFDRLSEISPDIEDKIIEEFKTRFGKNKVEEMSPTEVNKKYARIMTDIMEKEDDDNNEKDVEKGGIRGFCFGENEEITKEQRVEQIFSNYLKEIKDAEKGKSKNPLRYLKKPDICDELISANESRRNWYGVAGDYNNNINEVIPEDIELITDTEKRKEYETYKKQIYDFKNSYIALQGREPFDTEITDNLKEIIPINIIEQIIREK
jgi:hypothetical protein